MKQHSDEAWQIAALYSHVLASETRDLAAHIDVALQKQRDLLDECEQALDKCYLLIASEFADAQSQALEGEFVSREARPAWNAVCDTLAKLRAAQEKADE